MVPDCWVMGDGRWLMDRRPGAITLRSLVGPDLASPPPSPGRVESAGRKPDVPSPRPARTLWPARSEWRVGDVFEIREWLRARHPPFADEGPNSPRVHVRPAAANRQIPRATFR